MDQHTAVSTVTASTCWNSSTATASSMTVLRQVVTIRSCKVMPLPNVASGQTPQCRARSKRSLERCKNPAAYGMPVCRFHGARRPDAVLRGPSHPQYRHGRETLETRRSRVEAMTRIRLLADLGVLGGFLKRRVPGRRPNRAKTQAR